MKLLLEILGMTDCCNLDCSYCEWKKEPIRALSDAEYAAADANLLFAAALMRQRFPSVVFVEYSGGEPYVHPRIVQSVLDAFADRWVRVSTNGLRVDAEAIRGLAGRKAYLAFSLDGNTDSANLPRFKGNPALLQKALANVAALLSEGVPVMLLCTLNHQNIDQFPRYLGFLEDRFGQHIERGLLTLPAHLVSEYLRGGSKPHIPQIEHFEAFVRGQGAKSRLIAPIHEHYLRLVAVMQASAAEEYRELGHEELIPEAWKRLAAAPPRTCLLHDWQVCVHFLGDRLATDGVFRSFGCGMRAVDDLGAQRLDDSVAMARLLARIEAGPGHEGPFGGEQPLGKRCPLLNHCLVDWNAIDMILDGTIPLERAQSWSVMFRDPAVAQAMESARRTYQE